MKEGSRSYELYFATSNKNKFKEASKVAKEYNITLKQHPTKGIEIRSDDVEDIAVNSVREIYTALKKPVFVEDTGLFIDSLHGFPGAYSGWVYKKIGTKGILNLLTPDKQRTAIFKTAIALKTETKEKIFSGVCKGKISEKEKGDSGFAYDKVFIPLGYNSTFAERIELKNQLSHRYRALTELFTYVRRKVEKL